MLIMTLGLLISHATRTQNSHASLQADNVVYELCVVNHTAERSITLIQEYNAVLLTQDKEQTQYALQIVQARTPQTVSRF